MNNQNIIKKIKEIEEIVEAASVDEKYKTIVFQILLPKFLDGDEISFSENKSNVNEEIQRDEVFNLGSLGSKTGLTEDEMKDIFDFQDGKINLITPNFPGESVADKQKAVVISYLTASYFVYGKDRESANVLRELCNELGIEDKGGNFSKNLAKLKEVRPIGKRNSSQKEYKLTILGRNDGIKMIRSLGGKESVRADKE